MRPRRHRESGVSMLEFSLTLPILLMIMFGMIEYGVAFYDKVVITNASRGAARIGMINTSKSLAEIKVLVESAFGTSYWNNVGLITFGATTSTPIILLSRTHDPGQSLDLVTATVTYQYTGLLLGGFLSSSTPSLSLVASTIMESQ
jgi:Flp pilus assembly protein TadG